MRIKNQDVDTQISFDAVIIATARLLPGTSRRPTVRTCKKQIMSSTLPLSIAIIGWSDRHRIRRCAG
ncbi:hypothetical protein ACVWWN_003522 [Mycobacterium sp. URHB0021]|jgi:hypothetical protein